MATPASGTTAASRRQSKELLEEQGLTDVSSRDLQLGGTSLEEEIRGLSTGTTPITSDTLVTEPDFDIPDTSPTSSKVSNMLGLLGSQADSFSQQLAAETAQREQAEESSLEQLLRTELGQETESEARARLEAETGVPELRTELADIDAQILAEQRALENQLRDIEDAGGGLVSGQNIEMRRAQDESLRRQADLSVIRLGLQGKFDAAQTTANRAIDAVMDRQRVELSVAEKIYDRNKELFDRAEQRSFEVGFRDRERKLNLQEIEMQNLSDSKIEAMKMARLNGAPAEVITAIQNSTTPTEVFTVGGKWASGDLLQRMYQQAQIDNIYSTINQRAIDAQEKADAATNKKESQKEQMKADTEKALGIFQAATELANDSGLDAAVGFGFKKSVIGSIPFVSGEAIAGTPRVDFEANATRLADLLTLDNLKLMSGVLSETDIQILESAGSNLGNFNQSETQYKEEIQRVREVAKRTIKNNGLTLEQAEFYGITDSEDLNTINQIWE